ncbi:MAG TPA: hypothetical protein VF043_38115, partial [Ktedonobacteraceae bacterium]
HKPLLDTLLLVTFMEAARQELPVQFHTGYGDTDADMLLANPLHLRAVLERREYRAMPVVLLHEAIPIRGRELIWRQSTRMSTLISLMAFHIWATMKWLILHEPRLV